MLMGRGTTMPFQAIVMNLSQRKRRTTRPVRERARLYRTAPSNPTAQTKKLLFSKAIANMLIFVVVEVPSKMGSHRTVMAYKIPLLGASTASVHLDI